MNSYQKLTDKLESINDYQGILGLLSWDQEVMMPPGGAESRARQISRLNGMVHKQFTTEVPPLLAAIEEEDPSKLNEAQSLNVIRLREELDRRIKIPTEHVIAMSKARSEAHQIWVDARSKSDFSHFKPQLQQIVDLKKQETDFLGYEDNPYDALIDGFEQGLKSTRIQEVFDGFKGSLQELLREIADHAQVEESFMLQPVEAEQQLAFGKEVVRQLGYDLHHGRQDLSAHPFSIGMTPTDVRITTMVSETDIREMLYSSIHEAGHAMYEQGLPSDHRGWPGSEYCSLSIHESQSRLWENNVGRSMGFLRYFEKDLRALYSDGLAGKSTEDIFKAMNRVQSNPIRISSDELTYHFHIILRFEIENDLINGRISVDEMPEVWNAKVKEYLGLDVESDAKGVLQDIHWAHGSFGYFPTYSLGSFYAAQFMHHAEKEIPNLETEFEKGNFAPLKGWMRENIHQHGKLWLAEELCEKATGEPLNVKYFVDYARNKFGQVYGLSSANT